MGWTIIMRRTQLQAFTKLFINSCWEPILMWFLFSSSFCTRYESNRHTRSQPIQFLWEDAENTYTPPRHWKNLSKRYLHDNITYRILHHISRTTTAKSYWRKKQIYTRIGSFLQLIDGEKNHYRRIYNHGIECSSYLGWFQGEGGLNGKPWEADPCPKSRLWSCSISCDLRSLKKSSLVVSSTKVEDATIGCLPNSMPSANFGTLMDTEVFSVDMLVEASVPLDSLEEASNESLRVSGLEEP